MSDYPIPAYGAEQSVIGLDDKIAFVVMCIAAVIFIWSVWRD